MTNLPDFVRETIKISNLMKKIGEPLSHQQEAALLEYMLETWYEKADVALVSLGKRKP